MLIIDLENGEESFTEVDEAVEFCEKEFGYKGLMWDAVKRKCNLNQLCELLRADEICAWIHP
ncbi:hypothetical protein HUB98_05630 [Paenibacillus barcinonensis]|uniref:Uncharacterized protein n=1 Tax=Paenibacillus barcinonensis TaxID=198119 RepID=A0A2V4VD20_PAEBA|nr:hypothetical protein [Paenibacillus barcinonensis]PYE51472.1 hypothetical protein DFQ00_102266 [Paenibacillus barcinonensis]QKS55861.1 hypothetical protein HUB98_05630 [Paenibacillus barcinonensis]